MNSPEELPTADKSVTTSPACHRGWHRALWGGSLLAMTTLLAMHVALAHSPDLARFVPDRLIQSSLQPRCSSQHYTPALSHPGSCSHGSLPTAGCGARSRVDQPILTDSLYEEDGSNDQSADLPADAADCLPQNPSDHQPTGLQA